MLIEVIEVEVGHLAKGSTGLPCSLHPANYCYVFFFVCWQSTTPHPTVESPFQQGGACNKSKTNLCDLACDHMIISYHDLSHDHMIMIISYHHLSYDHWSWHEREIKESPRPQLAKQIIVIPEPIMRPIFSVTRRSRSDVGEWVSPLLTLRTELTDVTLVSEDNYCRMSRMTSS